jgi:chromosome partitioning protein
MKKEAEETKGTKKPILITIFNHKGGVGKTTATYNIGYILAQVLGLRVLLVDADSQSNLTGLIKAKKFMDSQKVEDFYRRCEQKARTEAEKVQLTSIFDIFRPLIEDEEQIKIDRADKVVLSPTHKEYDKLFFIPGHLSISELDIRVSLGLEGIPLHKSIPGLITNLFRRIAVNNSIDVVIFDLSPSLGAFNQAVLMGSDYFIVPFYADFFSFQVLQGIAGKFERWKRTHFDGIARRSAGTDVSIHAAPFFLGAYPQKVRTRKDSETGEFKSEQAYGSWINKIYTLIEGGDFLEVLGRNQMLAENFRLKRTIGILDFVGLGLDVQSSGRPISDVRFSHRHHTGRYVGGVEDTRSLTSDSLKKKTQISSMYHKLVGVLFRNLTEANLRMFGRDFRERIAIYSSINVDDAIKATQYLKLPSTPRPSYIEAQDESWYSEDEINTLMRYYLNRQEGVCCLEAVSGTYENGKLLEQRLNWFERERAPEIYKAIVPINLDFRHWALLYIRYGSVSGPHQRTPEIFYFDPFGDRINPICKGVLQNVYFDLFIGDCFDDVQIINLDQRVQEDGYNCGPWIVEAARAIVTQGAIPDLGFDIFSARKAHRALLNPEPAQSNREKRKKHQQSGTSLQKRRKSVQGSIGSQPRLSTNHSAMFGCRTREFFGYTWDQMQLLLTHYIENNARVLPLLSYTRSDELLDTRLADQLVAFREQYYQSLEAGNTMTNLCILPIYVNNNHYIALGIIYDGRSAQNLPQIVYIDPKGQAPDGNIIYGLKDARLFPNLPRTHIRVFNTQSVTIIDDECDDWFIEMIRCLAANCSLPLSVNIDIKKEEHLSILNRLQAESTLGTSYV